MSVLGSSFAVGQHVIVRRDVSRWLGSPNVRKGTRGVIAQRPSGLFSDRYLVNLGDGRQLSLRGRDLKATILGTGNDLTSGIKLGLLLAAVVPLALVLAQYYLAGGSTSGLIAALPGAMLGAVIDVLGWSLARVGLPVAVLAVLAIVLIRQHRR